MQNLEKDVQIRVYILDSLVAQSGKVLTPDLIGQLTQEILQRMMDVMDLKKQEEELCL